MTNCPVDSFRPIAEPKRISGVVVPNRPSRGQIALACVVANGMRLLAATLRCRVNGGHRPAHLPDGPVIFALWHNRLGLCMKVYKSFVRPHHEHEHLAALISASKDGALPPPSSRRLACRPCGDRPAGAGRRRCSN